MSNLEVICAGKNASVCHFYPLLTLRELPDLSIGRFEIKQSYFWPSWRLLLIPFLRFFPDKHVRHTVVCPLGIDLFLQKLISRRESDASGQFRAVIFCGFSLQSIDYIYHEIAFHVEVLCRLWLIDQFYWNCFPETQRIKWMTAFVRWANRSKETGSALWVKFS